MLLEKIAETENIDVTDKMIPRSNASQLRHDKLKNKYVLP